MQRTEEKPLSEHFPPELREALRATADIEDTFHRQRAIDQITEQARQKYPKLFSPEA